MVKLFDLKWSIDHNHKPSIETELRRQPNRLTKKTGSNTITNLEEDKTQQQNTDSDAGLKRSHNSDRKYVADKISLPNNSTLFIQICTP